MNREALGKAKQASEAARVLLKAGVADNAGRRAYYALFHIARYLISLRSPGFVAKTHAAVLSEFSRLYVRTGIVPQDWGRMINRAQSARHVAD